MGGEGKGEWKKRKDGKRRNRREGKGTGKERWDGEERKTNLAFL